MHKAKDPCRWKPEETRRELKSRGRIKVRRLQRRPQKEEQIHPALKDLLDEASKMLKSLSSSSSTTSTKEEKPEDNKEDVMQRLQQQLSALKQKKFQLKRMAKGSTQGLLDSGATHPMRPPHPGEEIEGYQKVTVALADETEVRLPMTSGGVMIGLDSQVEPIVPMGLITEVLGCEVTGRAKKSRCGIREEEI